MKKYVLLCLLIFGMLLVLSGCSQKPDTLSTDELTIEHETRFGGVNIHMTIEDFCGLGFEYGDAVDIRFSNGYTLENIPYYNGYYVRTGMPLLCAYPGYPYVRACYNNGDDLFKTAALTDDCTAVVTLRESGAYRTVQDTMSMVYSNERSDYASDEVFANFRSMSGGQLTEGLFFRSASPCDDQYNRAAYASACSEKAGIAYVLDLADSADEVSDYHEDAGLNCAYWKSLYRDGAVLPLALSSNYGSPAFAAGVAEAMRAVIEEKGPFLIHCTEGKDRTGFFCLLVEALAGAEPEELEADYMATYDNYYGVNARSNPAAYDAVIELKFNDLLLILCDTDDVSLITSEQLIADVKEYLAFGGMSEAEIRLLQETITAK